MQLFIRSTILSASLTAATDGYCPVRRSFEAVKNKPPSFLQEPLAPLTVDVSSHKPSGAGPTDPNSGTSIYDVDLKPAHFTCMKCDQSACNSAFVMCDISSCIGKFYQQECWCQRDYTAALGNPIWRFRKSDSAFLPDKTISQFFCDDDCTGGVCDTAGQQCKTRQNACKPWWWCGDEPPKEMPQGGLSANDWRVANSLVEERATRKRLRGKRRSFMQTKSRRARANAQLSQQRFEVAQRATSASNLSTAAQGHKFEPNDINKWSFQAGRWVCGSASLPPKVQNPTNMAWLDRGYLVFDRYSCQGGSFTSKCYCWDDFKYLSGKDPLTSELMCDDTCNFGGCDGKTCSKHPPPALPPLVKGATQLEEVLHETNNQMVPS